MSRGLSRYRLKPGTFAHQSRTCTVVFAKEYRDGKFGEEGKPVALKFMNDTHKFRDEVDFRVSLDGDRGAFGSAVEDCHGKKAVGLVRTKQPWPG